MDLEQNLPNKCQHIEKSIEDIRRILESTTFPKILVGKNETSREIKSKWKFDGIIDDYAEPETEWEGLKIVRVSDLTKDTCVFHCATSVSPVNIDQRLKQHGIKTIIYLSDLIGGDDQIVEKPWFMRDQISVSKSNIYQWWWLSGLLLDDESKKTLIDVLAFRSTADLRCMAKYQVRLCEQYFEDFMAGEEEVFVDAGGFDGDTTEEFAKRYPRYRKILFFEPSKKNMVAAKDRLKNWPNITYYDFGLSESDGVLRFDDDLGSASVVSNSSNNLITVRALDSILCGEKVTFIKMDLEGWESIAIKGAGQTIRKWKPKLAIAVYHKSADFYEIPKQVLKLNPNYKVFLRHYTQGWSETIMYFV